MTYEEKRKKFESDFKQLYPNYEIIELNRLGSDVIIKDSDGFLHRKSKASRFITHPIGIQSVIDKKEYVQFLLNKQFDNLEVVEYYGMKEPIIVKDENGFHYAPQSYDLLKGHSVTIESCIEKEKLFVFKANLKHDNKFSYPDFKYINGKQVIDIYCPTHGKFSQMIEGHLYGNGCRKCTQGGFSKESWVNRLINDTAIFYVLQMTNKEELFIKIGITSLSVNERYKDLKVYEYKIIDLVEGNPSFVYDLEKELIRKFKSQKYIPKIHFQGYTECFTTNIIEEYEQFKYKKSESY